MLQQLALIGFSAAALAYAVLAVLLIARGAPSATGRVFVAAVLVEAAWAGTIAAAVSGLRVPSAVVSVGEAARLFAWILFVLSLVRSSPSAGSGAPGGAEAPVRRAANAGLVAAATVAAGLVATDLLAFGQRPAFVVSVIASVFALVCLEQVYRNTPPGGRWALKFLALSMLALFAFDLVMYSEALLFSRLNPALWTARGFANALLVPLLAIAAARNRNWKLDIAVSRDVVFHSATLFGAGLYLIVMASAGYWVRWFGGQWGEVAQTLVVFAALVGLAMLLMSGTMRARLRVFLAKNFFSYRYDYRSEWLKLTALLSEKPGADAPPMEVRALQGLAALVESNGAALWLSADSGSLACAARWQYRGPTPDLSGDEPLLAYLRSSQWIVSLPEWRAKPDVYGGLRLPEAIAGHDQSWLVVPLLLHDDLLGLAVLTRPIAPAEVDWEVRDALKAAARQVASYLGVRRAVEALVQARQFESFNRMSAFVVHDLKNLVAQLGLLLSNAERHKDNPEFQQDMLDTVANVQARMQGLLMQLRAGTKPIEAPRPVPVALVLRQAIESKRAMAPRPELVVAEGLEDVAVIAHRDRLERVIGHLVQNAAEATPKDGRIWVRLKRDGERALIEVEDTGRGMSEQFVREQLFRPFESTKDHGMGIGAFESREYVRELGGSLDVDSRERSGTTFRIRLPLAIATVAA